MLMPKHLFYGLSLVMLCLGLSSEKAVAEVFEYTGMCDASASLAVDENHFIIANDEDNMLRIYQNGQKSPVVIQDLSDFFRIQYDDKSPESDIEGAAKIGDTYFFITSHGRDRKGRLRRNRHQFFAVKVDPKSYQIMPVGQSYQKLMDDLMFVTELKRIRLIDAYDPNDNKDEDLAPKERGVNIEGLAATPEGALLIGFRNPIPDGKAIIVELLNPFDVVSGQLPRFGDTYFVDMAGRGVRSMEYDAESGAYIIVGGSRNGDMTSHLYLWKRETESLHQQPLDFSEMKKFNPEAVHFTHPGLLQISSDDGTVSAIDETGKKCECKELSDPEKKHFRALWVERDMLVPTH